MLFSSLIFIYLFLPLALLIYYFSPRSIKNYSLLITSLIFFAWGGVSLTALLLVSITINYFFGLLIQKNIEKKSAYIFLSFGVGINLALLGYYKYADFIVINANVVNESAGLPLFSQPNILLPIGISFYTFHSLSYLVDIYRRKCEAQKNIFHLALYICMFSQLIAGPIIRYSDVWQQLTLRKHTIDKFTSGIERFLLGLARKVLLANTFAQVADEKFNMDPLQLDALNGWLGIICYTLQIYHDFAGYSDMAIGLGRMFGFEFMENFNFPYIATSVKEFWRRWHISLSTFFRDYVYIPLGGNKKSTARTYLNLALVFFLTGFWHGASWSFVIWGMFHGLFMILERLGLEALLNRAWKPVATLYTLLIVIFGWVLFMANDLDHALSFAAGLFNFEVSNVQMSTFAGYFNNEFICALIIGILACTRFFEKLVFYFNVRIMSNHTLQNILSAPVQVSSVVFYLCILALCTLYLVAGTYNPFIYYRF